jgi:uncharacterized protein YjiS (DUF1127 family)
MMTLAAAWTWASNNQALITISIGLGTGLFNWAAKPRTVEELNAMSARRAAFHRFMNGVFPDPQKAIEAAWQFWKNTHDTLPPKP